MKFARLMLLHNIKKLFFSETFVGEWESESEGFSLNFKIISLALCCVFLPCVQSCWCLFLLRLHNFSENNIKFYILRAFSVPFIMVFHCFENLILFTGYFLLTHSLTHSNSFEETRTEKGFFHWQETLRKLYLFFKR
jgi:hypothetical protein